MSGDPPVVRLDAVRRSFDGVDALVDASWSADRGEVVGLLGHNGAGKTTTLRLISGVLAPTGGTVRVTGLDPDADGATVRARTGVSPARPSVDPRLTVRENLRFVARLHRIGRDGTRRRIDALAVAFDLHDRLDDRVDTLSDGLRRRASLARMLLGEPTLLLLDEPTAALDPMAAHAVRDLLRDLVRAQGRTVVLATHDLIEAADLCDRVVVLQRGRVVASGTPAELARRVGGRGLLVRTDEAVEATLARVADAGGYAAEPIDTGVFRVHGVERSEVPGLIAAMVAADLPLFGVEIEQPTLTDFYLALHREDAA